MRAGNDCAVATLRRAGVPRRRWCADHPVRRVGAVVLIAVGHVSPAHDSGFVGDGLGVLALGLHDTILASVRLPAALSDTNDALT